jgi:hypothetical protein
VRGGHELLLLLVDRDELLLLLGRDDLLPSCHCSMIRTSCWAVHTLPYDITAKAGDIEPCQGVVIRT